MQRRDFIKHTAAGLSGLTLLLKAVAAALAQTVTPAPSDEDIWRAFAQWSSEAPRNDDGPRVHVLRRYLDELIRQAVPEHEALRRLDRINAYRRGNPDRDSIYWDAAYRTGDSPRSASPLVVELARLWPPGRALDAAMGNGRNAVFLARQGWQVAGYDMSAEAVRASSEAARKAGVNAEFRQATHDTFDYGESEWDLIVLCYAFSLGARRIEADNVWPDRLWRALKPAGVVVYYSSNPPASMTSADLVEAWERFRVLRFEDVDDYFDGWDRETPDGQAGRGREIRVVAQRPL
jgi:SAM-dependent methyltransferase